jgi:hypothetical protein
MTLLSSERNDCCSNRPFLSLNKDWIHQQVRCFVTARLAAGRKKQQRWGKRDPVLAREGAPSTKASAVAHMPPPLSPLLQACSTLLQRLHALLLGLQRQLSGRLYPLSKAVHAGAEHAVLEVKPNKHAANGKGCDAQALGKRRGERHRYQINFKSSEHTVTYLGMPSASATQRLRTRLLRPLLDVPAR